MIKNGFSLIECVIVLVIVSILVTYVFSFDFFKQSDSEVALQTLSHGLELARHEAMMRDEKISLQWQDGFTLLMSNQKLFSSNHHFLGAMHQRFFPIENQTLTFLPTGFTDAQNGTFWYCEKNAVNPAWAVMIIQSGRTRVLSPGLNNEIVDDEGRALLCG